MVISTKIRDFLKLVKPSWSNRTGDFWFQSQPGIQRGELSTNRLGIFLFGPSKRTIHIFEFRLRLGIFLELTISIWDHWGIYALGAELRAQLSSDIGSGCLNQLGAAGFLVFPSTSGQIWGHVTSCNLKSSKILRNLRFAISDFRGQTPCRHLYLGSSLYLGPDLSVRFWKLPKSTSQICPVDSKKLKNQQISNAKSESTNPKLIIPHKSTASTVIFPPDASGVTSQTKLKRNFNLNGSPKTYKD